MHKKIIFLAGVLLAATVNAGNAPIKKLSPKEKAEQKKIAKQSFNEWALITACRQRNAHTSQKSKKTLTKKAKKRAARTRRKKRHNARDPRHQR